MDMETDDQGYLTPKLMSVIRKSSMSWLPGVKVSLMKCETGTL